MSERIPSHYGLMTATKALLLLSSWTLRVFSLCKKTVFFFYILLSLFLKAIKNTDWTVKYVNILCYLSYATTLLHISIKKLLELVKRSRIVELGMRVMRKINLSIYVRLFNFKHDCNFCSDYTVQEHFSSPCSYICTSQLLTVNLWNKIISIGPRCMNSSLFSSFSCP